MSLSAAVLCSCSQDLQLGEESSDTDEAEITAQMINVIETIGLNNAVDGFVTRVNQGKSLGCLTGSFQISQGLPERLQQGIFAQASSFPAYVRFANASVTDDREKDFHGMSIKLSGVDGDLLWGEDNNQQDFILNSYPVLFAANNNEFLSFLKATAGGAMWKFLINPLNWDSAMVLLRGREEINSPFDIRYWSTTPYRFGDDTSTAVKYSVKSCSTLTTDNPEASHENFLRDSMKSHLSQTDACFDFMVQFQNDPQSMPIENASSEWDEEESPFETVARLTIPSQEFQSESAMARCEEVTFNPWQSLSQHRPLGGINRARRAVYSEAGEFRNQHNASR